MPYHHAKFDFFAPVLFLHRFIQDDVEEDLKVYRQQYFEGGVARKSTHVVSAKNAYNLTATIELNEESLVEILETR